MSQTSMFATGNIKKVKIIEVARRLGLVVASFSGVEYGPLFYRSLENFKIDDIRESKGNFNDFMLINSEIKVDLKWWIENINHSFKQVLHGNPQLKVRSDASMKQEAHGP